MGAKSDANTSAAQRAKRPGVASEDYVDTDSMQDSSASRWAFSFVEMRMQVVQLNRIAEFVGPPERMRNAIRDVKETRASSVMEDVPAKIRKHRLHILVSEPNEGGLNRMSRRPGNSKFN